MDSSHESANYKLFLSFRISLTNIVIDNFKEFLFSNESNLNAYQRILNGTFYKNGHISILYEFDRAKASKLPAPSSTF